MNILNYSLAALIAYTGLFIGFMLAIMAKEEIKPGKKYFIILQRITLLLIFIFLFILIFDFLLLLIITLVYILKKKINFNESPYVYIILAVIFYLSSKNLNLFIIESSLIFLYGLPTGTLLTKKSKKETIINILKCVSFPIITIILHSILYLKIIS